MNGRLDNRLFLSCVLANICSRYALNFTLSLDLRVDRLSCAGGSCLPSYINNNRRIRRSQALCISIFDVFTTYTSVRLSLHLRTPNVYYGYGDDQIRKAMSNSKYKQDRTTGRFVPSGEPVMAEKPISIRLEREIDSAIRGMTDRTEFLRDVITAAVLERQQKAS